MPVREATDRRGRAQRGRSGLLEREPALAAIDGILEGAGDGVGSALLIQGHAGLGKTRLYEAALDGARTRGMRVLRAAGAELEDAVAFGVARQLLNAHLSEVPAARRTALLSELPDPVRALAGAWERVCPKTSAAISRSRTGCSRCWRPSTSADPR